MTLSLSRADTLRAFSSLFSIYTAVVLQNNLSRITEPQPGLKWPNDLMIKGKKLGGILIETHWQGSNLQAIQLGIGINLNIDPDTVPESLRTRITSVSEWANTSVDRDHLATGIIVNFFQDLDLLQQPKELIQKWESRCSHMGKKIKITHPGESREGVFLGLGLEGQARMHFPDGEQLIAAGELS